MLDSVLAAVRAGARALILLTVTLAAGWGSAALAQPPEDAGDPELLVVEMLVRHRAHPVSSAWMAALAADAAEAPRHRLIDHGEALRRLEQQAVVRPITLRPRDRAEIDAMLARGDELVWENPKKATDVLADTLAKIQDLWARVDDATVLVEPRFRAEMLLARAYLDAGDEPLARATIAANVRTFGRDEGVTDESYHPRLVKLYRSVAGAVSGDRRCVLEIDSDPPDAVVEIDGRVLEPRTPLVIRDLAPGPHRVRLRADVGPSSWIHTAVTRLDRSEAIQIDLRFEQAVAVETERIALRFLDDADVQEWGVEMAARLGRATGAQQVLLGAVLPSADAPRFEGMLVDAGRGILLRTHGARVEEGGVHAGQVRDAAQVLFDVPRGAGGGVVAAPGPEPYGRWYQQWQGWALAGVGVAGLATMGVFLSEFDSASARAGDPTWRTVTARQQEADKAKRARTLAWVSGGVGGAALIGAGVWFAVHELRRPSGSSAPLQWGDGDLRLQWLPDGVRLRF